MPAVAATSKISLLLLCPSRPARVGTYEILAPIGAGGMGEVYRARDMKLGRDVAIKLLPAQFTADPDRRARFEREARLLAALNHPHIAVIHGLEASEGTQAIVLELVEGPTLAERLASGPLAIGEALAIARQVTDAIDAAHEKGIIHRDLKPANIKVTPNGTVKVLDFGLAKAVGDMDGADLAQLPTVTGAGTREGAIVGTAGYMSPEQARGQAVDKRTDIWAFGCVLYEMLTGRRAFRGDTMADTLGAILEREPDWQALPPSLSHHVRELLQRCLHKDASRRLRDIGDARLEIDEALAALTESKSESRARTFSPIAIRNLSVRKYALAAAAAVVLVAAGVLLWRPMFARPLTDKDVLVLADFTNTTGEAIFDGTLREALAIQLEESPFLKILGDDAVRLNLRLMGRSSDERITSDIAREICQRENQKATIGGAIAALGTSYVITLQSTNCRTSDSLARAQAKAADKEHVLDAVAEAAKDVREKLGESLSSIQKLEPPPDQVTTTSLEAFQMFAQGVVPFRRGAFLEAIPLFQRAVDRDPDFATAWEYLATSYQGAGEGGRRVQENHTRAFALRDRVTERERFTITTSYYRDVTNEWHKSIDSAESWVRTYPRSHIAYNNAAIGHARVGEIEDALRELIEAYHIEPRNAIAHTNLASLYIALDRFDEARTLVETELALNPDEPNLHGLLLRMASIQGDAAGAQRQIQWFEGKPTQYLSLQQQSENARVLGRLREADGLLRRANEIRQRRSLAPAPGSQPVHDALLGWCARTQTATAAGALALSLCGNAAQAAERVDRVEKASAERPNDVPLNAIQLPMMRAALELQRDQPAKAIDVLQPVAQYAQTVGPQYLHLRALSYLRAGKGREAIAEFQTLLDRKGANWGAFYPSAYVGLARAAVMAGDTAKVKKAYEDSLALWKDADADIPLLIEARREYTAIR